MNCGPLSEMMRGFASGCSSFARSKMTSMSASVIDARRSQFTMYRLVNPHKWLYVPAEASCILVRNQKALKHTFQVAADYLREENDAGSDGPIDYKDYSPQLHRSFRALKIWMTFKAYGARRLRSAIESNIETMRYLADLIDASQDFVRLAPVPLSIVCFQYRTSNPVLHDDERFLNDLNTRVL